MGRTNTKKFSSSKSLAGAGDSAIEPTQNTTNANVTSPESGYDSFAHVMNQGKTSTTQNKDSGVWGSWLFGDLFKPYDDLPKVNPQTQDQDTNNTDKDKTPNVNNGADNGADNDVQEEQNGVTTMPDGAIVDGWQWQYINGKYVKVKRSMDSDNGNTGSGRFDNGSGNGTGFADPNIVRLNNAVIRQQENMELIASQMQANTEAQQAYADKVNTSLMEEINGLYEANGKQNELNDLIIDATNQKWMTQLGDEIVPIQSQNAFKEPLPLKQFDVSSITGSKYFIFIVVGIIALIGLSLLKGKGSGAVRSAPMSVRYG